ncbi:UDP-N-acetylmuramate dehydrogenase [Pedobacter sp. JCM 36344]|uniref:UDP-N-acetylmuramate dehydrogenase n=1 Tax=Pedobacter sp. JCM 36344 TaxID=3374280 RepID=UPI00397AB443
MVNIQKDISLKPYNTFGISANATGFVEVRSEDELIELLRKDITKEPFLILGGGSNVLFTRDFQGLVVKISIPGISSTITDDGIEVTAGAGVVWNDLVMYCVEYGFAGMENLSLIPGTVGASPVQNIGAYGVELKDIFKSCTALEIRTGIKRIFSLDDCRFTYRDSIFKTELKGRYIITSVVFKLTDQPKLNTQYGAIQDELKSRNIDDPTIRNISDVVSSIRVGKLPDPSTIGNAGSFFKNPVINANSFSKVYSNFPNVVHYSMSDGMEKLAAGWLIEQCGFKGIIVGNTGTWKHQALVLVNHGRATGAEVYSFSEHIIETVNARFGVLLEREVNIM